MILETLRKLIQSIEPAAHLVEPRILRRVIRLDRRLPGFGLSVLRRQSYAIERERLLAFVELAELELPPAADLPRMVILLAKPDAEEAVDRPRLEAICRRYMRLLFHACATVELEDRWSAEPSPDAWLAERRGKIGELEFAEIRTVLLKDEFVFPAATDLETYCEFAALYLELRYFAPDELPIYFPGVRDWGMIEEVVSRDIDHAQLFERFRYEPSLVGDSAPTPPDAKAVEPEKFLRASQIASVSLAEFRRMQARAERIAAVGNSVKAAIEHARAARVAPAGYAEEAYTAALGELMHLARRLQQVLELSHDEMEQWSETLQPLLVPAAEGFWSDEARLLYDLQKVCVEQERGIYRLDLVEWIRTRGSRPVRRPLPLLRDALMIRHLRTAHRRVAAARMSPRERQHLRELLAAVVRRFENRSRDRIRPAIERVLDEVGLAGRNLPEHVARRKLIEELLDRVIEHSYLSMADLRDALSKNDLKMPDVLSVGDLAWGDRLLRADRKLDAVLDGIYRRGAIYQRWPQTMSSLAFGTQFGRFLTRYLAVPFGGAYLALAFILHTAELIQGKHHAGETTPVVHESSSGVFYSSVLLLGTWILLMMHRPEFRAWNLAVLRHTWRAAKLVFYETPARVIRSQLVQQILHSHAYATVHNYALRPAAVTGFVYLVLLALGERWSNRGVFELFLVMALVLNSSLGRYFTEMTADIAVRAWHELRIRVIGAVLQWIMDLFQGLLVTVERVVYTVDEWLRFRAGDRRAVQTVKAVGGVVWFFVAYVVVFVFTLLIEPQINPIKHFPVVTVAHKIIFPTGPAFVGYLTQYIGKAWAHTLVWTTIWLIPGVFGYLVWELKENWRLYAANRRRTLRPVAIGSHGETMLRLLRPGFHSGTLPKAYAALRRANRKVERAGDGNAVTRRLAAIHHVEADVRRFVERELLALLREAGFLSHTELYVGHIRSATNRIDVEVHRADEPSLPVLLSWEEEAGKLVGVVERAGWIDTLTASQRTVMTVALAGLFQRSGIDVMRGDVLDVPLEPISWKRWVHDWSELLAEAGQHDVPAPAFSAASKFGASLS